MNCRCRGVSAARMAATMTAVAAAIVVRAYPAATQQSSPPPLVFDGVTVVDVEQGKLVPGQRVVVVGNRIQAVGTTSSVAMPQGAQVVAANGKYLMPGLWDLHTHARYLAHLFYPLFVANGVTGIRDAWSEVPIDTLVLRWHEILEGKRVGPPRQLLAGDAFRTELDSAEAARAVDSLKKAGANFLKLYPYNHTVAAAARRAGLPFGGHIESVDAMEASDSGAKILDHITSTGGLDTLCLEREATVERCQPAAEHLRRNNSWWTPTWIRPPYGAYGEGPRSGPVLARFEKFVSEFWSDTGAPNVARAYLHGESGPDQTKVGSGSIGDSLGFMYVVQRAGLPTLAATDAGAPVIGEVPPGFSLHAELALYVAEGMTPLEALRTATLNPAKLLQGTDSLGTVAAGKLADLVLLDADPLADITNTTTIRAVVANGRYFDRAALDGLLAEVRKQRRAQGGSP